MPATGTAPALGAPRGAESLATPTIGLPPSEPAAAANASLAGERPEALAGATKAVSSAWSMRGPPAVAADLEALIAAVSAEMLARLLSDALSVASGASVPGGGAAPVPAGPAAPAPAGPSSGLGASAVGGLGLGILALLLALSPLGGRLLRYSRNFPRPNSALVLAIERPG
jgi:hypothetical protein